MQSPLPPESVGEFYTSQLKSDGWEATSRQSGESQVISANKDGTRLIVSIAAASPGSTVTVSYSHE